MPETPEVQALADELAERLVGRALSSAELLEGRLVKTRGRGPDTLVGAEPTGVLRHGKLVDLAFGDRHLVVSLGRHGWMRWVAEGATSPEEGDDDAPPPALASLAFDGAPALELTDAGTWLSLGLFVVDDPADVPAIAKLGPDPADDSFTRAQFDHAVAGRRKQVKAILIDQAALAGIGNAYSDEICFAARVSPVIHASELADDALDRLFAATTDVVRSAVAARRGIPIADLKAAKTAAMQVHGRAGEPCPGECGGTVRDFAFGSTTAQYCPDCQTGGALLAEPG
ncbi:DNA-formamidopyrimidine glycosylase family protein [Agromyces seonyuensis]|uniref:Fpg/Nei family DNA glycosylase n=1 Tax=Agromyces seonyuensis TaxID=2662446 RepID=A0A6I4P2X3_9MICO|nr:DNA-formamidopyrimidine glycosylase family protein [Agromyces seonyuensis]MWB99992.1 Fpg/Nei family DNA glycosylase [Agromyces seonyuensis]